MSLPLNRFIKKVRSLSLSQTCVSQQHELLTTTSRPEKKSAVNFTKGTQDVQDGTQRADIQNFPYSS